MAELVIPHAQHRPEHKQLIWYATHRVAAFEFDFSPKSPSAEIVRLAIGSLISVDLCANRASEHINRGMWARQNDSAQAMESVAAVWRPQRCAHSDFLNGSERWNGKTATRKTQPEIEMCDGNGIDIDIDLDTKETEETKMQKKSSSETTNILHK